MRLPRTRYLVVALTALTAVFAAGCGSSSNNTASSTPHAQAPLRESFTGKHSVTSGEIELDVRLAPSGSAALTAPVTIAFGGSFQSAAEGKVPQSAA